MRPHALLAPLAALALLAAAPLPARALGSQNHAAPPASSQTAPAPAPAPAPSQAPRAPAPAPPPADEVAPDSPRASVRRFLDLCRAGELAEAATYLDLPEAQKPEGPQLARHLKAVLDRHLWGKVDSLSPRPFGDPADHLPAGVELLGNIPGPNGPEQVRLVRRHTPDGARWIFSRATVERIDVWYGRLHGHWVEDHFPEALLRPGPKDLAWWQWIALPVLFILALGAGVVLGVGTRKVIARLVERTSRRWGGTLFARLTAPLTLVWAVFAVSLALPHLALVPPAEDFIDKLARAGLFIGFVWLATRCVDVGAGRVLEQAPARTHPAARLLVPLGAKMLKVTLLVSALLVALSELGVAVGSLVAGLGIGGVAIALAAQKTVENLFGSLSIGVDQPFRVGDFVTVDGLSGTVEFIGLRLTRIRTPDRTIVTLPNGKLADTRVESFASRDRMRLAFTLSVAHGVSPATLRDVLAALRALLADHPKVWPDVSVALARVTDLAHEIDIVIWFKTTLGDEFLKLREELLLSMIEAVEATGAKLAVRQPTP